MRARCALTVFDVCIFFFATLSGVTASLVLQSALEPLPGFSSSLLTLYVPVVLRDGASGLTNTGTVTVTICPCLRGGMQTEDRGRQRDRRWERHMVCLPMPSASTSLIFSLVTLLAMLACVTTLLGRFGRLSPKSPTHYKYVVRDFFERDAERLCQAASVMSEECVVMCLLFAL